MLKRIFGRKRKDPKASKPRRRFPNVLDLLMCLICALALVMLSGLGGGLAVMAAISIIGIPIAIIMVGAPFIAMVVLPWRLAYLGLQFVLPKGIAVFLALALTALALFIIDSRFTRGIHPDVSRLLAQDDPIPSLDALPDGRFALTDTRWTGTQLCRGLCADLLRNGLVREVVNVLPGHPSRSLTLRDDDGGCPSGWDAMPNGYCLRGFPEMPSVSLTVERFRGRDMIPEISEALQATATTIFSDKTRPVVEMLRMRLRDSRDDTDVTLHAFETIKVSSGLFSVESSGILGENLQYGPRTGYKGDRVVVSSIDPMTKLEAYRLKLSAGEGSFNNMPVTLLNRALGWSDRAAPRE